MKTGIVAFFIAVAALPAAAQATPRADARHADQEARIQAQAAEGIARADGKVTPRERARLAKEQNRQSRKFAKQKHDKERKAPAS